MNATVRSTSIRTAVVGVVCLLCVACADIRVRPFHAPDVFDAARSSRFDPNALSQRSLQTLRRLDLDAVYRRSPDEALAKLHAEALHDPDPDVIFAMAEGHYLRGRAVECKNDCLAVGHYYLCAGYAYHFLFPEKARPVADEDIFDPRYRLACDLYNAGLAKCISAAQKVDRLDPRHDLLLPACGGEDFHLSVGHVGFQWQPEEFGPLQFCADYQVVGLANHYGAFGLGVPLIGSRVGTRTGKDESYYPRHVNFSVTAFFRFEGTLADLGAKRTGRLELVNPLSVQAVDVRGRKVPLETDLTTPLAYYLAHSDLQYIEWQGFLRPATVENRAGIHMLEPYQPGKIPVVLVHGLLSSPLTWAPVYNDLQADPALRERFQFWAYFYPTGNPYLATAADLRRSIAKLRQDLDPQGKDAALSQMVFVGHSMGGLISKLAAVDSGDTFWKEVSNEPLADLKLKPETRAELQQVFFFERRPEIQRVIYIGTPHHGSKLSPSLVGRLAVKLVQLPGAMLGDVRDLAAENPGLAPHFLSETLPTSVDLLAPGAPALEALAARPKPPGVHYHSIVGVATTAMTWPERLAGGGDEQGDGVVPYRSAHIDDADSELVVDADHFHVHHHPLAIREVRRILLEHYREVSKETGSGIVPAGGVPP
jgi:pimeloyl-ACP methyl ester carboxylesterase